MNDDKRKLHDAIDVCRSGRSDHLDADLSPLADQLEQDSGLRDRFEASQVFDNVVRCRLDKVEVPADLHDRLLAQFNPTQLPARSSRRGWFGIVGAIVATAAALLIYVIVIQPTKTQLTEAEFCSLVINEVEELGPFDADVPDCLTAHPIPGPTKLSVPMPLEAAEITIDGVPGVVYRWRRSSARLVVLPKTDIAFGKSFPATPIPATNNWSFGVYQDDKFVYVLMTKTPEEYEDLVPDLGIA